MKNRLSLDQYRSSQNLAMVAGYVLVCLMMVSVAVGFAQLGARMIPGWPGGVLVALTLLIAIEAIYTRNQVKELETREKILFRVSEWVAFLVAIKLLLYVIHGFGQLIADLPRWQADFLMSFFTGEYLFMIFIVLVVWWSSGSYAGDLEELYERENDASWDELGKLTNALQIIRVRITTRVFMLGTLVVLLAVLSRIDATPIFRETGRPLPGYMAPVANVLVYFLLALVLLSMTQFALLRTRWLWQRTPISAKIAGNWVRFGLLFFAILAAIVFFLPTEYSLGFFETGRIVVDYFMQFASALMFLLMLPLTVCMALFSLSSGQSTTQAPSPMVAPPVTVQGDPVSWLEFLRSLAFWVIFLAIIFFAVRYYLSQNAELWKVIRAFPLVNWLVRGWDALRALFRRANIGVTKLVREGMKRLRQQSVAAPVASVWRLFNLARMTPREKIIHFYVSLVQLGGERGIDRRPSQTPYQYESRLSSALPEIDPDLHALTDTFLEARYSPHPVEDPQADQANSLWERIKRLLSQWKRRDD